MRTTIFLLFFFTLSAGAVTEKPCTTQETRAIRSWKIRAAFESDKVTRGIDAKLSEQGLSWGNWRKLHVAKSVIHCARKKLATLTWVCADGTDDKAAKTYPVISRKVYLSDYVFTETAPRYQEALFLHEATHHCGTNDARYFENGERPHDGTYVGWQVIADTYTYWVMNGFCVPGNC